MTTITPHYRSVQQLLGNQSFSIDEYQREYKWEKENIDELLTDLFEKFSSSYQPGHDTKSVANYEDYFLGSIIVCKRNGKNYLIDGQQRVTSLTLLLIYLYHAAKKAALPVVAKMQPLIFSDDFGEPRFNLDISERLPLIDALFRGEKDSFLPHGKDESIQTMYARYTDIESRDLVGELEDALPHFIYWLMSKVGLIEIASDSDNYAYAIFETMNDRGKPLSPVDMLKAYLLAPVEDVDERRRANASWKQQVLSLISWGGQHESDRDATCIKAWLRAQYADTSRERKAGAVDKDWEIIGSAFHRWVRDNRVRLKLGSEKENLAFMQTRFPFFASAYQTILGGSRSFTPGLEAIYYNAHNEFTWQNTVLLAPLSEKDDPLTVERKLAVTASYLDIWMMRRVVNYIRIGYSSTSYTMYNLCKDIRNKPLSDLVDILTQKLASDDVSFDGSPSRDRYGINNLRLNQFTRRYIYHLLARLTTFVETQSASHDRFVEYVDRSGKNPYDIEHICPADYSKYRSSFRSEIEFYDWRDHVAGLLLLPADVNRSFQDKAFEDKAPHYAKQNLYAASLTESTYQHQPRFVAFRDKEKLPFEPFKTFGKAEQTKRRELIHTLVHMIWSPSRLAEALK